MKDTVLDILEDLTGSDEVRNDLDIDIFETGLLDSMGTVQMLLELQAQGVEGASRRPDEAKRTETGERSRRDAGSGQPCKEGQAPGALPFGAGRPDGAGAAEQAGENL